MKNDHPPLLVPQFGIERGLQAGIDQHQVGLARGVHRTHIQKRIVLQDSAYAAEHSAGAGPPVVAVVAGSL